MRRQPLSIVTHPSRQLGCERDKLRACSGYYWRWAWVVLVCLLTGWLWIAGLGAPTHLVCSDPVSHQDGSNCPDSDCSQGPCGPMCPCTCCPGHRMLALSFTLDGATVLDLAPPPEGAMAWRSERLDSQDLRFRIFHPPRA
jgi:hypothetical protein